MYLSTAKIYKDPLRSLAQSGLAQGSVFIWTWHGCAQCCSYPRETTSCPFSISRTFLRFDNRRCWSGGDTVTPVRPNVRFRERLSVPSVSRRSAVPRYRTSRYCDFQSLYIHLFILSIKHAAVPLSFLLSWKFVITFGLSKTTGESPFTRSNDLTLRSSADPLWFCVYILFSVFQLVAY